MSKGLGWCWGGGRVLGRHVGIGLVKSGGVGDCGI